jgi:glyoxylase-like metal-dependent hydrolase (beta-lactamase superfamily II)
MIPSNKMHKIKVAQLNIEVKQNFVANAFHPTLIWDNQDAILVDTGIPGQLPQIRREVERFGVSFDRLTKVIITHHDLDHIGSLPEVISAAKQKIEVISHEFTKPFIQGEKPLLKRNVTVPPVQVNTTVSDGDYLPICGGITVIYTPGHTPDHLSLYLEDNKSIVAADATVAENGRLLGPSPQYTLNMEEALQSLRKFLRFDFDTLYCYHGGICKENVHQQIEALTQKIVK